ncbi:hypothetical protein KFE25_000392 [Diacronema lutheri]|uniref:Thioredoxin n=2 Tax=Diacronema lutheri TaxID=2081491 RepID=A0A8J6CDG7_DIALT|nr:hypothetical protein KFE25_000392 [Diacronema lutheri]
MAPQLNTLAEFDACLANAGDKLVVVDFTAAWCGPCQRIAPKVQELSEMTDIVVVKVDVDENQETAEKCKISSMPTFQFYKHGKLVHQFSGASEDQLLKSIAQHK